MIPKITKGGSSFKSALQYYLHDKQEDTKERVAWARTENMRTGRPLQGVARDGIHGQGAGSP